jgi:(R,R)-butanediol dehydrogenase/meso-butanediol dehydrogenase/diacetyl reductase/L-iditol 2-dehydrogenase
LEQGAFLEPVSVAIHVVDLANIRPGSSLAILGSGPIGLLIQQVALRAGAVKILVGEPSAERRQIAKELGASVVVDTHNENLLEMSNKLTDGRGFDTVIDASGKLTAAKQAITMADKGGTIVWVGGYPIGNEISVTPSYIYSKELTIRTALSAPYCFERALKLLPQLKLKPLISIMPLEKINNAFQLLANGQGIKILIKP